MLYRFGIKNVIKVNNLNLKYTTNLLVFLTWVQNLCNIKWLVIMSYDIQSRFSNEICWDHIIKILQYNFYLSHIFSFNRLALSHNNLWLITVTFFNYFFRCSSWKKTIDNIFNGIWYISFVEMYGNKTC